MTVIGAAAVLLVAGWCAYNFIADWPSRYKGGIFYDRMVHDHVIDSLVRGAVLIALPLVAFLYQVFGYGRLVGPSSDPHRRKLGNTLFLIATVTAAGFALLSGGALFLQIAMDFSRH